MQPDKDDIEGWGGNIGDGGSAFLGDGGTIF